MLMPSVGGGGWLLWLIGIDLGVATCLCAQTRHHVGVSTSQKFKCDIFLD